MSSETASNQTAGPKQDKDFYYAVQPNKMTYLDGAGVSRCVHIPRGKNQEACEHIMNEDWEALELFPTWSMYPVWTNDTPALN